MIHEIIHLNNKENVTLTTYIHTPLEKGTTLKEKPAVIILPGGAFGFLSDKEGEPVALTFMKEGFQAFVLRYSVGDESAFPNPLHEISQAISLVRNNAQSWGVNPNQITVMGFSAGACICAMIATQWNRQGLCEELGIQFGDNKPNLVVLGYGACKNSDTLKDAEYVPPYLGKIAKDLTPELDIIHYVSEESVPAFIWHTRYDKYVPSYQALKLALKYDEFNIPYELHVFEDGRHGMSVANDLTSYKDEDLGAHSNVPHWVDLSVNYLKRNVNI